MPDMSHLANPDVTASTAQHVATRKRFDATLDETRLYSMASLMGVLSILGPYIDSFKEFARGIEWNKFPVLLTAIQDYRRISEPLNTVAGVRARVYAAMGILTAFADLTPGERDNELIDWIQGWMSRNTDMVEWIVAAVMKLGTDGNVYLMPAPADGENQNIYVHALTETMPELNRTAMRAWDLTKLAQIVGMIVQVIHLLK